MKKYLFLSAIALLFLCCGSNNEPKHTLEGTLWKSNYVTSNEFLEFTTDRNVERYVVDYGEKKKVCKFTYSYDGKDVKFNHNRIPGYQDSEYKTASIDGQFMKLKAVYKYGTDTVYEEEYEIPFQRQY